MPTHTDAIVAIPVYSSSEHSDMTTMLDPLTAPISSFSLRLRNAPQTHLQNTFAFSPLSLYGVLVQTYRRHWNHFEARHSSLLSPQSLYSPFCEAQIYRALKERL